MFIVAILIGLECIYILKFRKKKKNYFQVMKCVFALSFSGSYKDIITLLGLRKERERDREG